jgi:hypothetical protein
MIISITARAIGTINPTYRIHSSGKLVIFADDEDD